MTNNAPVFWDIQKTDGTWFSLHTYAWSVKSFGGRRWLTGPKRGEDLILPHRRGRIFTEKTRDAQVFDLNMWVFPINEDGSKDAGKSIEQKAHENWRKIIGAVDQEGQFRIRKRWYDESSTRYAPVVRTAEALAEFMDGSGPDSDDGKGFYISLTFSIADPYFYGNQVDGGTKAAGATTLGASTNISVQGEAPTTHLWLSFEGTTDARVNFPDGNWVQLLGSHGAVVLDCTRGLAMSSNFASYLNGAPTSNVFVNGLVRRNPYQQNWPILDPTRYPISTLTTSGAGTIRLVYDPAYR